MRFFAALSVLLTVISLASCNGEIRDFDSREYEKASPIGTYTLGKDREELHIKTSRGVNANVILVSRRYMFLKFQDEKEERKICDTYWILSSEIRQLRERDLLFVRLLESHMTRTNEWENDVRIYVYDLSKRKLIGWTKM
jgi:hypothetical protein